MERREERYPTRLPLSVVENLISIPSIQQLYRSLIFDKGQSFSNGIPEGRSLRSDGARRKAKRGGRLPPLLLSHPLLPLHSSSQEMGGRSLNRQIEIYSRDGSSSYLPVYIAPQTEQDSDFYIRRWGRHNEPHDGISFATQSSAGSSNNPLSSNFFFFEDVLFIFAPV